jgi:arginyl-tRNA synthetase
MLNIFHSFKEIFSSALTKIAAENSIELTEKDFKNFTVEPTKERAHGDLACNVAMVVVKKFATVETLNNPRKLAARIIDVMLSLSKHDSADGLESCFDKLSMTMAGDKILKLEIAGAGFINIFLKPQIFYQIIFDLLSHEKFEFQNLGNGEKINLEYASPNPTGPIHVGHTRGAIYGDVLATLLQKVGYDVLKEYYINDAGSQIITLLKSAYLRYLEALGEEIIIPEGFYPGEYLIPIGEALKAKFGESLKAETEEKILAEIRDFVVAEMLEMIKSDLLALGIKHDSYFSEKKNLHDTNAVAKTIEILRQQGLVFEGKLEAPKTEKGVGVQNNMLRQAQHDNEDDNNDVTPNNNDVTPNNNDVTPNNNDVTLSLSKGEYCAEIQTLFRSTKFGDDQDRVVKKADGNFTYFAADMAYAANKFARGAKTFIMPLGYDHAGYVKRLSAAVEALTQGQAQLKVILCQMVKFVKNGEQLKMSKRSGNFVTAREVIEEVGADALRFIMLTRKNDAPFDFDLAKVIEQSRDNPIFYVQYGHARCCSVLRNLYSSSLGAEASEDLRSWISEFKLMRSSAFQTKDDGTSLKNLTDESEIELIKKIANFPRVVEMAAVNFEPHRIAFYLQELAAEFHALWNKGTENPDLKFIIKDNLQLTQARIYLVLAVKKIIAEGLAIFNIKAVEEMR